MGKKGNAAEKMWKTRRFSESMVPLEENDPGKMSRNPKHQAR